MFKICIDPGHGGNDPGAIGPRGLKEADVAFSVATYLAAELKQTGRFEVLLTRDQHQCPGLRDRGQKAANWKADGFISEHCNASTSSSAGGAEVFYSVDLLGTKKLASDISAAVAAVLSIADRGAKTKESDKYPYEDYYGVIDAAQDGGVPVVLLVESAFISNPQEEALLAKDNVRQQIAEAQARVICTYFGVNLMGEAYNGMFKDMGGHWAAKDIEEAAELGLVAGKGDGIFAPDEGMTRAQGTVVTLRAYRKLEAKIVALEKRLAELEGRV